MTNLFRNGNFVKWNKNTLGSSDPNEMIYIIKDIRNGYCRLKIVSDSGYAGYAGERFTEELIKEFGIIVVSGKNIDWEELLK